MTTLNWTAIIVALLALIGSVVQAVMMYKSKKIEKKKAKNNPSPNQGSFLCLTHGDRLLKLELRYDELCREMKGIKSELTELKRLMK